MQKTMLFNSSISVKGEKKSLAPMWRIIEPRKVVIMTAFSRTIVMYFITLPAVAKLTGVLGLFLNSS